MILKVQRTIFYTWRHDVLILDSLIVSHLGQSFFFGTDVVWLAFWVVSYDSCDMEHAALGSVFRASR